MFQIPKKTRELRDTPISVRLRKSVADKVKEMAEDNDLSVADVLEYIIEVAYSKNLSTKDKKKRK